MSYEELAMEDVIEIRRATKSNVLTTTLLGLVGLLLASQIILWLPTTFYVPGILLASLSIVTLLVAFFKYREPLHSFILSRQTIHYQHKNGHWQLDWNNIQRIAVPRITQGVEQNELMMVGIKLKSYQPLLLSTGMQGMLANRMQKLRQRLGFDLYIAGSELDRSEHDFVQLLQQCQQHVMLTSDSLSP